MKDRILLTASNLAGHLACKHLTGLDRLVRLGKLEEPFWKDPVLKLLRERGIAHEKAYLEHLRAKGRDVEPAHTTCATAGTVLSASGKD